METGIVFDIKEFTLHDGPGIRTTVFLKGCPMACSWCHNPEGESRQPQMMRSPGGDRLAGMVYSSLELATLLNSQAAILKVNEGGITLSGGEPLLQANFIVEVINLLEDVHIILDTSGYGTHIDVNRLIQQVSQVYFDLKIIDPETHLRFTGCSNRLILENLEILGASGVPFVIRLPMVPGVTDTDDNLTRIAHLVKNLPNLVRIDLLPYNPAAGSKYKAAGMEFKPGFNETQPLNLNTSIFQEVGLEVRIV